ncbi:MAG: OprO/OprP family phosphate-selective porin [Spirochaetota bacterium]|nr:OprO/OprP family phosphate-selective porin [Spirochaetota bacterium]
MNYHKIRIVLITFFVLIILLIQNSIFPAEVALNEENIDGFKPTLRLEGNLQFRHEYNNSKGVTKTTNNFAIRQARIILSGNIYTNVNYKIEIKGENLVVGKPGLKIAYINFTPYSFFNITAGVLDVPFTREQALLSSKRLLLMDRSSATNNNVIFTDIGLMFSGEFLNKKIKYWLSITNGAGGFEDGINGWRGSFKSSNTTNNYFDLATRLQFDLFGDWKDGKVWFTKDLKSTIGFAVYYSKQRDDSATLGNYAGSKNFIGLTADFGVNYNIFYLEGAIIYHNAKANPSYGTNNVLAALDSYIAYYAQLGITIYPKYFVGAIRWDSYKEDPGNKLDDRINDGVICFTWYIGGNQHKLKFQTEGAYQHQKGVNATNASNKEFKWRNQLSLLF